MFGIQIEQRPSAIAEPTLTRRTERKQKTKEKRTLNQQRQTEISEPELIITPNPVFRPV